VGLNQELVSASSCEEDWKQFNCIMRFGDGFSDGDLVLWQMRIQIELEIANEFCFNECMVNYEVMEVTAGI